MATYNVLSGNLGDVSEAEALVYCYRLANALEAAGIRADVALRKNTSGVGSGLAGDEDNADRANDISERVWSECCEDNFVGPARMRISAVSVR